MYNKIVMQSLPAIVFAHGYQAEHYDVCIKPVKNLLEIDYFEQSARVKAERFDEKAEIPPSSFFFNRYDATLRCSSAAPKSNHFAVGFACDYGLERLSADELRLSPASGDRLTAIVPDILPFGGRKSDAEEIMKRIIVLYAGSGPSDKLAAVGGLFELLGELTRLSFSLAQEEQSHPPRFASKYDWLVRQYVNGHIGEKIYVQDIAAALGVSYGYLGRIIRNTAGMTLIEFVNAIKLEHIKTLLASGGMTLKEAGRLMGISDEKYLSRIFKRQNGITISEYRRVYNNAPGSLIARVTGRASHI